MSELTKFIDDLKLFLNEHQTKVSCVQDRELKKEPDIFDLNLVSSEEHNELKDKFNNLQKNYNDLEYKYRFLETAIESGCNSNLEETKKHGRINRLHSHYSNSLQYIYDTVDREIEYRTKYEEITIRIKELNDALKTIHNTFKKIAY